MPDNFLWGAATSSHQVEGGNEHNDWADWEAQGFIEGGVRSGAACDHWNRFREDLAEAAALGMNSYRFSVEWSRLEPEEGRWDPAAFEWYSDLIAECEKHGLVPMLTLHHFTSPRWFTQQGGFASAAAPEQFARYVRRCIEVFGARVPLWCTINEPMVLAMGSYVAGIMPPAVFSPRLAAETCRGLLASHVRAYDLLRAGLTERSGPFRSRPVEVGIAHNLMDFMPDRRWHPGERLFSWLLWRFYNRAWLDAVTGRPQGFGVVGLIPKAASVVEARGRCTADFIGVNYYTKAYVQWRPRDAAEGHSKDIPIGLSFARRREPQSDLGWAVHPRGLRKVMRFAGRYGLPLYVTENGIADHQDALRGGYLLEHLKELARLRREGLEIKGYYHWSLLDNFEWVKGFGPRFGLLQVDYATMERKRTPSAELYRKIIEAHRDPKDGSRRMPPDEQWLG